MSTAAECESGHVRLRNREFSVNEADLELMCAAPACSALDASTRVPQQPGYYAIYVDVATSLPAPFSDALAIGGTRLIYIGIASKSLNERLVSQDLHHRSPSTFFRGIGGILGYRPPRGSLSGKSNQNNFRFSASDTAQIVSWNHEHLSVNWIVRTPAVKWIEAELIRIHCPILNTKHNPDRRPELAAIRNECRAIARCR